MARLGIPLDPGALDQRVTIQYRIDGSSTTGYPVEDWTTTASRTVWMARQAISGMERIAAQQVSAKADMRFVMSYRADMDPDLVDVVKDRRLVFQGRTFNITSAMQMGAKAAIELTAVAKVG